jgi:uncharacterized protein (TIGR02145 family)
LIKFIDPTADTTQCCSNVAGIEMKNTNCWNNGGNGTNSSGFSALPGGYRYVNGTFGNNIGIEGYWWTSTDYLTTAALMRGLLPSTSSLFISSSLKIYGISVRCVRD